MASVGRESSPLTATDTVVSPLTTPLDDDDRVQSAIDIHLFFLKTFFSNFFKHHLEIPGGLAQDYGLTGEERWVDDDDETFVIVD